ncbi:DUF4391 domain-containing protein [Entomomonas moraniae]|uniref:DUF4391 domain-containing protein n=1 Tax=Entomomonas moraniae TaxID=2213226 RepID=A0A3Q9JLX2_9GAMM|nr:DUF4391 domain-containing protein [Entomomonas moraniae]AZS51293.1 DUF4391 domain-containing protein [Entomomonas moraniae]
MPLEALYAYPEQAKLGRILPKNKLYEQIKPNQALKNLFITQIEQIQWQYVLASRTINLIHSSPVPEIQVFTLTLKGQQLDLTTLKAIDQVIKFPTLFEVVKGDQAQLIAAYKRPNEVDNNKWVISDYFLSPWLSITSARQALPVAVTLAHLYQQIIHSLLPYVAKPTEQLEDTIERISQINSKTKQLSQAENRLLKEKQFNKKLLINSKIKQLQQEIAGLIG